MDAWQGYSPRDFLLFSERTYWRLFELHNEALWPLHAVALPAIALLLAAALLGWRRAGLATGAVLALGWAGVAVLFLDARYEPINWAIAWVGPVFMAQAALLLLLAPGLRFEPRTRQAAGGAALAVAALAWPLLAPVSGRPLVQAEVAGLAPDPTALATLGLVVLARPGWRRPALAIVPLLWLGLSAATLFTMRTPAAWAPLAALAAAIAALSLARPEDHGGGAPKP